jgi:hypothetical protein
VKAGITTGSAERLIRPMTEGEESLQDEPARRTRTRATHFITLQNVDSAAMTVELRFRQRTRRAMETRSTNSRLKRFSVVKRVAMRRFPL